MERLTGERRGERRSGTTWGTTWWNNAVERRSGTSRLENDAVEQMTTRGTTQWNDAVERPSGLWNDARNDTGNDVVEQRGGTTQWNDAVERRGGTTE